jgi:hypothetical protein
MIKVLLIEVEVLVQGEVSHDPWLGVGMRHVMMHRVRLIFSEGMRRSTAKSFYPIRCNRVEQLSFNLSFSFETLRFVSRAGPCPGGS